MRLHLIPREKRNAGIPEARSGERARGPKGSARSRQPSPGPHPAPRVGMPAACEAKPGRCTLLEIFHRTVSRP